MAFLGHPETDGTARPPHEQKWGKKDTSDTSIWGEKAKFLMVQVLPPATDLPAWKNLTLFGRSALRCVVCAWFSDFVEFNESSGYSDSDRLAVYETAALTLAVGAYPRSFRCTPREFG